MALKMLRENKDRFDLVISDVHIPDMDGFKLLELVGLEMDLPVIMLSANSDTKLVMKGVTHGACDHFYLGFVDLYFDMDFHNNFKCLLIFLLKQCVCCMILKKNCHKCDVMFVLLF